MKSFKRINIDLETYSSVDLNKAGVYKYTEADDFEILLFGYAIDGGEKQVIDLKSGQELPKDILEALKDTEVEKWAFNANFERIALSKYIGHTLSPEGWFCTMVWAATLGLPLKLEAAGEALGLEKQKLAEGKELIRYFCKPCKPTKANGQRTRNLPEHAPDKWARFIEYNKRDVEAEDEIQSKLAFAPPSPELWAEYHLDQRINDRGIKADRTLALQAISLDEIVKKGLVEKMVKLTGITNPNSVTQVKNWLEEQGEQVDSLGKKQVAELIGSTAGVTQEAMKLRAQMAKSSIKKYQAIINTACKDDRVRGMFQFYGAARSGRFAGRLVQLQNLPQNHLEDLAEAREVVRSGQFDTAELLYDVPDTLSQLIRTAFIPDTGRFIVADFSAIEARVIAWLAGEKWRLEVFEKGGDIYCASASQMFKVPVEKHGINGHLRQKGKIAELACGYGGGVGALKQMGALEMGIPEGELQSLIDGWRASNPHITKLWWDIDKAVKSAITTGALTNVGPIKMKVKKDYLFIKLPSGRKMAYKKPRLTTNRFGGQSVDYEGVDGNTKKWTRIESYGPKFVENIVQGISRDLLIQAMQRLEDKGYKIVAHVHDEVIIEAQEGQTLEDACSVMSEVPDWAKGLRQRADGYECQFYQKD